MGRVVEKSFVWIIRQENKMGELFVTMPNNNVPNPFAFLSYYNRLDQEFD